MNQNRWKSPVVWTSIIAIVVLIGGNYGIWSLIGMEETLFTDIANLIISVLVMVGILNNPTDKEEW